MLKFGNISKALFQPKSKGSKRHSTAEFMPLNDKNPEITFAVMQREGKDEQPRSKTLVVTEEGIQVTDNNDGEVDFVPFHNIKTFYVNDDTLEWRMLCALGKDNKFEIVAFRTPRAQEIQTAVTKVIQRVVRERRSMTM